MTMATFQKVKIKDHCEITSSRRIFADEYLLAGVPFYRGKEISEKQRSSSEVNDPIYISKEKYEEIKSKYGVPQKGDLLLTSVGTIGNPYLVKENEEFYFKDGNLTWFRKFQGINGQWLYYWILSPQGKSELNKCTIGSSQKAYTINLLYGLQIELPDIKTQTRIASVLSTYDDLIENNENRIMVLEEMAQLLYTEWFVKFNFPGREKVKMVDSVTEYGKIPKNWRIGKFEDTACLLMGLSPKGKFYNSRGEGLLLLNGAGDFNGENIVPERFTSQITRIAKKGDIIFCIRGTIGNVTIADRDYCIGRGVAALSPKENYYSYSLFVLKNIIRRLKHISTGAVIVGISKDDIAKFKVLIPSKNILVNFSEAVYPIIQQRENLRHINSVLGKARDLLIPQLVTGKRGLK